MKKVTKNIQPYGLQIPLWKFCSLRFLTHAGAIGTIGKSLNLRKTTSAKMYGV